MTEPQTRAGIADVARAAGVSSATASLALNGKGRISAETRERIKQVALDLNYRPNLRAQRLRRGHSHTVALYNPVQSSLPTDTQLDFALELAMPFAQASLARGYSLLLIPPLTDSAQVEQFDIDGVVVMDPMEDDPYCAAFHGIGAKVVTIGRAPGTHADAVVDRPLQGAGVMLAHLAERGAHRIGVILPTDRYALRLNLEAYLASSALPHGVVTEVVFADIAEGEGGGRAAAARLLDAPEPPDGIYAPLTPTAVGAWREAAARGIDVPRDLMIGTNYDARRPPASELSLTSLDLHLDAMAETAAGLLLDLLGGGTVTSATVPEPSVIPRASTDRRRTVLS